MSKITVEQYTGKVVEIDLGTYVMWVKGVQDGKVVENTQDVTKALVFQSGGTHNFVEAEHVCAHLEIFFDSVPNAKISVRPVTVTVETIVTVDYAEVLP